jgi:hypothetical protein
MEEANKWYSEAVALNSQSYLAHYYYAANLLKSKFDDDSASKAEASLRAAIKINPGFAPAFDALSWLLSSSPNSGNKPERLHEAYMMSLTAIGIEPGNILYRLNSVHVLERMGRVDDAVRVADHTASMARTPDEQAAARAVLAETEQYRSYQNQLKERQDAKEKAQAEVAAVGMGSNQASDATKPPVLQHRDNATTAGATSSPIDFVPPPHPPRPELLPSRQMAEGTVKDSNCIGATLEITLSSSHGVVQLYSDKYMKILYSALNYTPTGILDPCVDMKGWHARITYHPAKAQPNQGEMVAVDLIKD